MAKTILDPVIELEHLGKQIDTCIDRAFKLCNVITHPSFERVDGKLQSAAQHCLACLQSARQLVNRTIEGAPPKDNK